jgi:4-carboxymuconolactone decarboxylase
MQNPAHALFLAALLAMTSTPSPAQEKRFADLAPEAMTEAQKKVYDAIAGGPRGGVRGPFNPLLRSPELANRVQAMGEYLRFNSSLPPRLNELAILITARYWSAQYEWHAHHPLAIKGGLDPKITEQLARGVRPEGMKPDEAAVYDFCKELHEQKSVSDAVYKAALEQFGERGIIDLIGVSGYYSLVSMVLNVDRTPLPAGTLSPLPALK